MKKVKAKVIFKACMFDLYDTLVFVDRRKYLEKSRRCAEIAKLTPQEYESIWQSLIRDSNLGFYPTTCDRMRAVGERLGVQLSDTVIAEMVQCEHDFLRSSCYLYEDSLVTLSKLPLLGLQLAIVSNASPSVLNVLEATRLANYVDHIIFSFQVSVRKPAPEIYLHALCALGVVAEQAIFVGDGNEGELYGAKCLGMTTVKVDRGRRAVIAPTQSATKFVDFTVTNLIQVVQIVYSSQS